MNPLDVLLQARSVVHKGALDAQCDKLAEVVNRTSTVALNVDLVRLTTLASSYTEGPTKLTTCCDD